MTKKNKSPKRPLSSYARYSFIGMQMAGFIFFFTWFGSYLDVKTNNNTPWWTLGLSLFGVISSLILVIKEVIQQSKNE